MIEICKLEYATIYLNRDQKHQGRLVVTFNEHKTEYHQLTDEENRGYFKELAIAAKAIDELYHPDKINYATFGDGVPHVHVHVVPKHKDGLQWGAPFQDDIAKVLLTEEEYAAVVAQFKETIEKLLEK